VISTTGLDRPNIGKDDDNYYNKYFEYKKRTCEEVN
jgi:hypothetical protein